MDGLILKERTRVIVVCGGLCDSMGGLVAGAQYSPSKSLLVGPTAHVT